ncbi:MAG: hypothetical protein KGS60_16545 [Verrucomicrobia bacterium]|nr:hypothetical protein [Verrucomicrobiota bacterium]
MATIKHHDEEFHRNAVDLLYSSRKPLSQVARAPVGSAPQDVRRRRSSNRIAACAKRSNTSNGNVTSPPSLSLG